MDLSQIKTVEQCEGAIIALRGLGLPTDELEALKKKLESVIISDSETPIYDTLVANYPYYIYAHG